MTTKSAFYTSKDLLPTCNQCFESHIRHNATFFSTQGYNLYARESSDYYKYARNYSIQQSYTEYPSCQFCHYTFNEPEDICLLTLETKTKLNICNESHCHSTDIYLSTVTYDNYQPSPFIYCEAHAQEEIYHGLLLSMKKLLYTQLKEFKDKIISKQPITRQDTSKTLCYLHQMQAYQADKTMQQYMTSDDFYPLDTEITLVTYIQSLLTTQPIFPFQR